jgi:hypothetical protein
MGNEAASYNFNYGYGGRTDTDLPDMSTWAVSKPTMPALNMMPYTTTTPTQTTAVSAPSFMSNIGDGLHNMVQSQGWQDAFGWTDPKTGISHKGYAAPVLGAISGIGQSWLGMKQLGLAQEQFDFKKDAWGKEYNNQVALTNERRVDRQKARLAAAPGSYQSVGDYMNKHKVG